MIEALSHLIERGGYPGIVLLTFIETIFPPLPSEVFMPMAGYVASRGELGLWGVIVAGTLGSVAGACFWYAVGRAIGLDRARQLAARHGRWLTLHPRDIDRGDAWFDRYGGWVVLFGRMVPAIRSVVSVPAGIAHMPVGRFLMLTTIGTAICQRRSNFRPAWRSKSRPLMMRADDMQRAPIGALCIFAVLRRVIRGRWPGFAPPRQRGGGWRTAGGGSCRRS